MKNYLTKTNILIGVLLIVISILLIRGCSKDNKVNDANQITNLNKALTDPLKKTVDKNGDTTYSKQAFIAEIGLLTDALSRKDKELATLANAKNKAAIKTNTVIKFVDSGKTIIDTVKDTRSAVIANDHYTANVVSTPVKTTLSLVVRDTAVYAIDKKGVLNVKHSNPYLSVVDQNAFIVLPKVRKKNWKYWVGGIIVGGLVYGVMK